MEDTLWKKKEERQLWNIINTMFESDLKDISMVPDIFLYYNADVTFPKKFHFLPICLNLGNYLSDDLFVVYKFDVFK